MNELTCFGDDELGVVNDVVSMAEELAFNSYKISTSEWKHHRYDIRTLVDLKPEEIVSGPFAQIIRYEGRKQEAVLEFAAYDFYKICLQDHYILKALGKNRNLDFFPFLLYIVTHELVHVVRFGKFLQNFEASVEEKVLEESRVHEKTYAILKNVGNSNIAIDPVFEFYGAWRGPIDELKAQGISKTAR